VGLGSGTLACYAESGESWTFYEIDPMMDYVARDSGLLTQVKNSRGDVSVVLGDGRLKIQSADPGKYNIIVLDAFSSDAVPIHLLTREALRLYLSRLAPDGLLIANISNRYVNLRPTLARTARLEGLDVRTRFDNRISEADGRRGRSASHWMVMSRDAGALRPLDGLDGWITPPVDADARPWTDDYSNILQALMLR
jgi:spermidine synthase